MEDIIIVWSLGPMSTTPKPKCLCLSFTS